MLIHRDSFPGTKLMQYSNITCITGVTNCAFRPITSTVFYFSAFYFLLDSVIQFKTFRFNNLQTKIILIIFKKISYGREPHFTYGSAYCVCASFHMYVFRWSSKSYFGLFRELGINVKTCGMFSRYLGKGSKFGYLYFVYMWSVV